MNKPLSVLMLGAALVIPATMTRADKPTDFNTSTGMNTQVQTTNGQDRVLSSISSETGVPVSTLQAQRAQTGLGFGELRTANLLANATGKSFDDIVALKNSGMGWGKIAKENNVKLGPIVSAANRSSHATSHVRSNNSGAASFNTMGKVHGRGQAKAVFSGGVGDSGGHGAGHGGGGGHNK